jgi:hypothetical protein
MDYETASTTWLSAHGLERNHAVAFCAFIQGQANGLLRRWIKDPSVFNFHTENFTHSGMQKVNITIKLFRLVAV